jgi:hypothetical protein
MKTEYKYVEKREHHLNDALGSKLIPSNVILNKTLTGIGATYLEIHAERSSIIIEPNVPVIKGKIKQHSWCKGSYKRCTQKTIEKYLKDDKKRFKKIITTPESFGKVMQAISNVPAYKDVYNKFFCLFDECEKIGQDIDYRETIAFPINDFFKFKGKAFVSATPLKMLHDEFEKQEFRILKIEPLFDYKEDLELIVTNQIRETIKNKIQNLLDSQSKCICIFYNSSQGIKDVIDMFNLTFEQYMIFCADKTATKFKQNKCNVETDFDANKLKRINFFTSRYYSAVDFNLVTCPDVLMITNLESVEYSRIDPLSEAIQIQGRFRKSFREGMRFKSLTHITNLCDDPFQTEEQVKNELSTWLETAESIRNRYLNTKDQTEKDALKKEFVKLSIYPFLTADNLEDELKYNTFPVINKYNKERVKSYYSGIQEIQAAYEEANYFNVTYNEQINPLFPEKLEHCRNESLANPKITKAELIQNTIYQLEAGSDKETILLPLKGYGLEQRYSEVETIIEGCNIFGIEFIKTKTTIDSISKAIEKKKQFDNSEKTRLSTDFIQIIIDEFQLYLRISTDNHFFRDTLNSIFRQHGIIQKKENPYKATLKSIEIYFNCTKDNSKQTITLKNPKEMQEIIDTLKRMKAEEK